MHVFDRGPTRGHRYVVMDGRKRVAVFDTEKEATGFLTDHAKPTKPKWGGKGKK